MFIYACIPRAKQNACHLKTHKKKFWLNEWMNEGMMKAVLMEFT